MSAYDTLTVATILGGAACCMIACIFYSIGIMWLQLQRSHKDTNLVLLATPPIIPMEFSMAVIFTVLAASFLTIGVLRLALH